MIAIHIFELQARGITWQFVDFDFESVASAMELDRAVRAAVECFVPGKVVLFRHFDGLPVFADEADIDMEILTLRLQVLITLLGQESMAVGVLAPGGFSIISSKSDMLREGDTVAVDLRG